MTLHSTPACNSLGTLSLVKIEYVARHHLLKSSDTEGGQLCIADTLNSCVTRLDAEGHFVHQRMNLIVAAEEETLK